MDLNELRKEIDEIDQNLVYWLEKRLDTVSQVAEDKIKTGKPVLDAQRERAVTEKAASLTQNPEYREKMKESFAALMAVSRRMQEEKIEAHKATKPEPTVGKSVAYCGIPGCFAEEAVLAYFTEGVPCCQKDSFGQVVQSVDAGEVAFGVLPIENSSAGPVGSVEDMIGQYDVHITGEVILPVHHELLGVKGSRIEDIRTVSSHPQAIDQCARYIAQKGFAVSISGNTAFAARDVAKNNDPTVAAIASRRAASIYGLDILESDIQTSTGNYTRFVVIEKKLKTEGDKISIVCVLAHKPGSLYALLGIFARHGLNLMKLLARPILDAPWHYRFHFDFTGSLADENVRAALAEAEGMCDTFKITGFYKGAESI